MVDRGIEHTLEHVLVHDLQNHKMILLVLIVRFAQWGDLRPMFCTGTSVGRTTVDVDCFTFFTPEE